MSTNGRAGKRTVTEEYELDLYEKIISLSADISQEQEIVYDESTPALLLLIQEWNGSEENTGHDPAIYRDALAELRKVIIQCPVYDRDTEDSITSLQREFDEIYDEWRRAYFEEVNER